MRRAGKKAMRRGGKKRASKPRAGLQRRGLREAASLTEVLNTGPILATNQSYVDYTTALAQFPRAVQIARGYQFYRIKRITYVIKPTQDTFANGTNSVPYLYYMVDRVKQFAAGFSIGQLKSMGAKARRLDDKTLEFSLTPSVLTETYDNQIAANTAVQYRLCPWLPTKDTNAIGVWNPNTTDHQGMVWRVEQVIGPSSGFTVERRVEIEFKKPSIDTQPFDASEEPVDIVNVV